MCFFFPPLIYLGVGEFRFLICMFAVARISHIYTCIYTFFLSWISSILQNPIFFPFQLGSSKVWNNEVLNIFFLVFLTLGFKTSKQIDSPYSCIYLLALMIVIWLTTFIIYPLSTLEYQNLLMRSYSEYVSTD